MPGATPSPAVTALKRAAALLPDPVDRALRPLARRVVAPWNPAPEPELPVPPRRAVEPVADLIVLPDPEVGDGRLTVWPDEPPAGYRGQLEPAFQARLAERFAAVELEDCYFYHRSPLPDGRVVEGTWNLVGGEAAYLGDVPVAGRRVLELGPASGWLTVWMAGQGADVVGFDLGWDLAPDLIPLPQFDLDELRASQISFVSRVHNAWWFLKRAYGHDARVVYGPIYDMPDDLGRFDVAVFGSILLHLRDPFRALEQAAARTDDTIVVVEPLRHGAREVDQSVLAWNVSGGESPNGWWSLSPGVIVDMLGVLGFTDSTVTYHRDPYRPEQHTDAGADVVNYTVVARRPAR